MTTFRYSVYILGVLLSVKLSESVDLTCIEATCIYEGVALSADDLLATSRQDLESATTTCTSESATQTCTATTADSCFERVTSEETTAGNVKVTREFGCLGDTTTTCNLMANMAKCCNSVPTDERACQCSQQKVVTKCKEFGPVADPVPAAEGYNIAEVRALAADTDLWTFGVTDQDTEHSGIYLVMTYKFGKRFQIKKTGERWTIFATKGFAYPFSQPVFQIPVKIVSGSGTERVEKDYIVVVDITDNKSPTRKATFVPTMSLTYSITNDDTKAGAVVYKLGDYVEDLDTTALTYSLLGVCDFYQLRDFEMGAADGQIKIKSTTPYLGYDGTKKWMLCTTVSDGVNSALTSTVTIELTGSVPVADLSVNVYKSYKRTGTGEDLVARLHYQDILVSTAPITWSTTSCPGFRNIQSQDFPQLTTYQDIMFNDAGVTCPGDICSCSYTGTSVAGTARSAVVTVTLEVPVVKPVLRSTTPASRTITVTEDAAALGVRLWTAEYSTNTNPNIECMARIPFYNCIPVYDAANNIVTVSIETKQSDVLDFVESNSLELTVKVTAVETTTSIFTLMVTKSTRRFCFKCDSCADGKLGERERCKVNENSCCRTDWQSPTGNLMSTRSCARSAAETPTYDFVIISRNCCSQDFCNSSAIRASALFSLFLLFLSSL